MICGMPKRDGERERLAQESGVIERYFFFHAMTKHLNLNLNEEVSPRSLPTSCGKCDVADALQAGEKRKDFQGRREKTFARPDSENVILCHCPP